MTTIFNPYSIHFLYGLISSDWETLLNTTDKVLIVEGSFAKDQVRTMPEKVSFVIIV